MQAELIYLIVSFLLSLIPTLIGAGVRPPLKTRAEVYIPRNAAFKLVEFNQIPPTNYRWISVWWGTWIIVVISVPIIGVVAYMMSKGAFHGFNAYFTAITFMALTIFIGGSLVRDVILGRKKLRLGKRTRVANSVDILLDGEFASLMRQCQQSLATLGVSLTKVDTRTGIIEGILQGNKIQVKIVEYKSPSLCVKVTSDSTLPTIRYDGGSNFRNVNGFVMELLNL